MTTQVTIWNEFRQEHSDEPVRRIYPDGIHVAVADGLRGEPGVVVRTATLDEPEHGLTEAALASTDVLVWWGHVAHDEVSDAIEGPVRPRVRGDREHMVVRLERAQAVDAERGGHRLGQKLGRRRPRQPARPVQVGVDLDEHRDARPFERELVGRDCVEERVSQLDEPGGDERGLSRRCVARDQIHVDEGAEDGIRVARCHLGPLVDDELRAARVAYASQELWQHERGEHARALGLHELGGHFLAELAPPPRSEEVEPVRAERVEVLVLVDEAVDGGPEIRRACAQRRNPDRG